MKWILLKEYFQDASCNKLKSLPADIALLKSLRVLRVRDNQLTHLPAGLQIQFLMTFD